MRCMPKFHTLNPSLSCPAVQSASPCTCIAARGLCSLKWNLCQLSAGAGHARPACAEA